MGTDVSPQGHSSNLRATSVSHVRFGVDKQALRVVSLRVLWSSNTTHCSNVSLRSSPNLFTPNTISCPFLGLNSDPTQLKHERRNRQKLKAIITSHSRTNNFVHRLNTYWVKGKAIPLQAWTGPEGSRSFRIPDFKTEFLALRNYRLYPPNIPGTHFR